MNRKLFLIAQAFAIAVIAGLLGAKLSSAIPLFDGAPTASAKLVASPLVPVGNGFTYQGNLIQNGSPVTGQYDFEVALFAVLEGGNPLATTTALNTTVTNGLFTVVLNFGAGAFQGEARWIEVRVRPVGGSYITLTPRQPLTAAPYAVSLVPGAVVTGTMSSPVLAIHNTSNGSGIYGTSNSGRGVHGLSATDTGVHGQSTSGIGVNGSSESSRGVHGQSTTDTGVHGQSTSGIGVFGTSSAINSVGVKGDSTGGYGVIGNSTGRDGVQGNTSATGYAGVAGGHDSSSVGNGVYGQCIGNCQSGGGKAGYFLGDVLVTGNLSKGGGSFKIDDPLDPANKYLYHSFVESPDMMNVYNGEVTLDAKGEATVTLPDWFETLNRDFRYQLTAIEAPGPNLYIAQRIQDNSFKIAGGAPNMAVSWQVTGIRQDPYANAYRIPVEQDKPADEKGYYLHPELYGQPNAKSVDPYVREGLDKQSAPSVPAPGGK